MDSESEEFFDPMTSFTEKEMEPIPNPQEPEELKQDRDTIRSKDYHSKDSQSKESQQQLLKVSSLYHSISRQKEVITAIKTTPAALKFYSKKKVLEYNNIRLLQEIDIVEKQTFNRWVILFSHDCSYLSIGGTGGRTFVYSLTKRERNGVYDYREKFLSEHSESVTSLSWNKQNKLISGSKDNRVLLWSPSQNEKCEIFEHPEKVRVCKFFNSNNDYFVTGCKDNLLRVFSVSDKQPIGYYQLPSSCYSLDFDPSNKFLAVGLDKGEVMLYHIKDEIQLRLYQKKHCRNQQGIYSKGRKVVALKFLNHDWLLVTTADSRIRLMNYLNWTLVQKFKGHKNLNARIAPDFSLRTMTLVSGSEDGKIYFWKYDPSVLKNPKFECFQARDKKSTEYVAFASGRVEEEIRQRVEEGHVNHVIFSVGAKQSMKIFVVLSSD